MRLLAAFASATQDIVIDAYRIEAVELKMQGTMAASYQVGYRVGIVAGRSRRAVPCRVHFLASAAYQVMALLMLVGIVTVLLIDEPDRQDRG